MTASLALRNILVWSLQTGLLIAVASVLPSVLRLKMPNAKLAFWQIVLVSCLLLPGIRSWKQDVISGTVQVSTAIVSITPDQTAQQVSPVSMAVFVLVLAGAGILVRLTLLISGFRRLRRYRVESQPLAPVSAWCVEADLRVSEEIGSPVTFGFRKPVVLLPTQFSALSEDMRDAILCHEILHVRRKDWLFTLGEEFVGALFWFHPAIWWLLREIQLAREQAVDREVVKMTRARDQYIDALLVMAGAPPQIDFGAAPLFLRKRHLKQRLVSILKEGHMSTTKSMPALAAGLTVLAASCWFVTGAFPLLAAPQVVPDASGVSVETRGAQMMHRAPVEYPREAIAKGVEGIVVAEVKLDATGNVTDASIISGPEALRKAVLQSVLNWHFTPDPAVSTREISVDFVLPKAARQTMEVTVRDTAPILPRPPHNYVVKSIQIEGLSDAARQQLLSQLPVRVGDMITAEKYGEALDAVHAFDSHLGALSLPISQTETAISIAPYGAGPSLAANKNAASRTTIAARPAAVPEPQIQSDVQTLRVGAEVLQANLVTQVHPSYPPLAKAARVQGTVRFEATIAKDGTVQNLKLMAGPPLLVQAAMEAVRQWIYKPTLLNGNPVAVITTVDVNFTLAE